GAAGCKMSFSSNPKAADLNGKIQGNGALPSLADRLPAEPLVVVPYETIGRHGGVLDGLSNAPEAGTSDLLSVRHVSLVRYSDDLATIVPNVAKSWEWNSDFTKLTINLRKGHKWSDGAPFTSADVKFWYDDMVFDTNIIKKPKDYVLVAGKRMTVDTPDATTVVFNLPAPKPGLLAHFATHYSQPFMPRHFLGKFHPKHNTDADKEAAKIGFATGYEVISAYYGNSDWTDTPTMMLANPDKVAGLEKAVMPSLESHVTVAESTEGRRYVANPYFHMVDTAGNQLPYISEIDEVHINDNQVRILKLVNAEVDYKSQSVQLPSAPILLENQEKNGYTVDLKPTIAMPIMSFNVTSPDEAKRAVFGNLKFRQAMSLAMNRDEINEVAYFGLGVPKQYIAFSPTPEFAGDWEKHMVAHDPATATKLLDEIGVVDKDGDGFRDLPNGDKLVLNLQFATQGLPGQVVELVAQHWTDVGIKSTAKEVTPDEYRSAQSSNALDIMMWQKGQPLAIILGNSELFQPPFENYFGSRTGMLWAEYVDSNGTKGVKPPAYVLEMLKDIDAFQSANAGTPESNEIGARLVKNMTENLLFIGTVQGPNPVYHRNAVRNFPEFKTWSYEYYRTYPYRPQQWFLEDES
ncbi:MAG: ABC transporter substrate-binding protein, partial [Alphaproteobacteria bacterium]|nr:ABC transporter substrate-binding protein [Alphaproteobacteria bacterium]